MGSHSGSRAGSAADEECKSAGFRPTDGDGGDSRSGSAGGDEAPPVRAPGTSYSTKGKQKRRRCADTHDILVFHATRATNAHVAPRGKIMERYEEAAAIFNDHPQAPFIVTGKVPRDRFNSLKGQYLSKDETDANSTGVEEVVTELDTLLCDIVPVAVDYEKKAAHDSEEVTRFEENLVADDESIRRLAMERRRKRPSSAGSEDCEEMASDQGSSGSESMATPVATGRRRRRVEMKEDDDVVVALQQSEKRRDGMAMKKLDVADRRFEQERQFHQDEIARRERLDAEHREQSTAHLRLVEAILRKLG